MRIVTVSLRCLAQSASERAKAHTSHTSRGVPRAKRMACRASTYKRCDVESGDDRCIDLRTAWRRTSKNYHPREALSKTVTFSPDVRVAGEQWTSVCSQRVQTDECEDCACVAVRESAVVAPQDDRKSIAWHNNSVHSRVDINV
jgi:hypothetical protein